MTAMLRAPGRFAVLLALSVAACGDTAAPPVPTTLTPSSAAPSTAVVGSTVTAAVKVLDDKGKPMQGVAVNFEVTAGGGTVAAPQASTDATGVASSTWTLASTTGTNTLVARSGSLAPVTFNVNALADAPATIAAAPGNVTTGTVGAVLNPAPGVRLTDRHGNPVQGALVTFSGPGAIAGLVQTTDAQGIARPASWTLGGLAGVQNLTAVAGALSTTLSVTASAGAPTVILPLSGNLQTAAPGATLPIRPSVRVTDSFSNGIPGVQVNFAVSSGGGVIAGNTAVTDAGGNATAGPWTLGPTPGTQVVVATMPNGQTATFTATAVDPAALSLTRFAGDNTTCPISTTGCSFTVLVRNGLGDPVQGQAVLWTNGTQTQTTSTNAQGRSTVPNLVTSSTSGAGSQRARLVSTGQEVTFAYQYVQPGGYDIQLRFINSTGQLTSPPASWGTLFADAEHRWESVITGDLPNSQFNGETSSCSITHPAMNEVVDDLVVWVKIVPIDGVGNVLGSAGPCWVRGSTRLPVVGIIQLDSADVAAMERDGSLDDVVLHEMGHTLGIGSLWQEPAINMVQGAGGNDPYFSGIRAVSSFQLTGGILNNGVPVENSGGSGTRDSHWREATFNRELMTGFINSNGANPLSVITIGSLMDIGYQVNFGAADTYLMPNVQLYGLRAAEDATNFKLNETPLPAPRVKW
jgi:hypothetical protein